VMKQKSLPFWLNSSKECVNNTILKISIDLFSLLSTLGKFVEIRM
jgi:hypothetical protein